MQDDGFGIVAAVDDAVAAAAAVTECRALFLDRDRSVVVTIVWMIRFLVGVERSSNMVVLYVARCTSQ